MASRQYRRAGLLAAALLILVGCEDGIRLPAFIGNNAEATDAMAPRAARMIERDVEAPEVFQMTDRGLWDGRPSLGGVWVTAPDITDPERVIIRNTSNGSTVIGALYRRARETPGPVLQVSSDAAAALGMLAGQPAELDVTALRIKEVPEFDEEPDGDAVQGDEVQGDEVQGDEPEDGTTAEIESRPLKEVAAAAIDAAEIRTATAAPAAETPRSATDSTARHTVQIGIFSIEDNAAGTAELLRAQGIVPTIRREESRGQPFWRVVVGPVTRGADRAALLEKVRSLGFADAYFVRF